MDADLVARGTRLKHDMRTPPADVGARQQRAVEQGANAVMLNDRGALHLGKKTGAKYAFDGPPGVVGAKAKEERGQDVSLLKKLEQSGRSFQRAS
jgi:hypothetical protein